MEPVTLAVLQAFLERLGERFSGSGALYLLGGSALALLGSPRTTVDVDYTFEAEPDLAEQFDAIVAELAAEMHIDAEAVPISEFVPLPRDATARRRVVGTYGQLEVYIFDLYTIALSKIARGFEADLEDVLFLLCQGLIDFDDLQQHFESILPDAPSADIIPDEFRDYFEEVRRRWRETSA